MAILLLMEDGEIVYRRSFGKISPHQSINIGTASSWPAAVVLMHLVDQGVLTLDDPVKKHYPEVEGSARGEITLRQLLTQTAGMPADHGCLTNVFGSVWECGMHILQGDLSYNAGERFELGFGNLQAAGGIAVRATGKNWQDLYRDVIKFPMRLGMMDFEYGEYYYLPNPRISDGLYSSVNDYASFMGMILYGGTHGENQIISPQSIQEMFRVQLNNLPVHVHDTQRFGAAAEAMKGYNYGLGVWIDRTDERTGVAQSIVVPGSSGFIPWMDLESKNGGILVIPGDFDLTWSVYTELREMLDRIGK